MSNPLPILVVVGRPNVGKSTLFNRLTHSRRAIVGDQPGITRDRIKLEAKWRDRRFLVTDTGGMTFGEAGEFPELINERVRMAVEEADHIVFVVDGRSELTRDDRELADYLRRSGRPVTVAVNKCDTDRGDEMAAAFYELSLGDPLPVSAEHDRGIDELLDKATEDFPAIEDEAEPEERLIKVAIVGRPNVGKSTLLNRLTGGEHSIVSPTAGTTRDAVDVTIERDGVRFEFVDTAGIRRKGKTKEMAEKLSVMMAQRHVRLAHVVIMMLDAVEGVTALDANIAGYAHEAGRGVILVVNKWDQLSGVEQGAFERDVRDKLKYLDYAPVAIVSALKGYKTDSLYPLIRKVYREWNKRIGTGELNRFLGTVDFDRVTVPGFTKPKIGYVTQAGTAPPTFVFFTNSSEAFHFGLERFLINQLRKAFRFEGAPIIIKNRAKKKGSV